MQKPSAWLVIALTLTCTAGAAHCSPPAETFTFPAEFEPQQAMWIGARPMENGHPTLGVVVDMARALSSHVDVYLVVTDAAARSRLDAALRQAGVDMTRVRFETVTSSPTQWYRDIGPIFVRGSLGGQKIIDFDFNCYGDCKKGSSEAKKKEGIDRQIAADLNLPVVHTRLVSEGGDREVNGRGIMMAVESVELQRNPALSRDQIERELLKLLGQTKMIWLKRGVAEDDDAQLGSVIPNVWAAGAGGHIDEMARFTAPDTIVLEQVTETERDSDPVMRESYRRLAENYRILRSATDQDHRRFRIVRMPAADPVYTSYRFKRGDPGLSFFRGSKPGELVRVILPRSYMNFVVSNGVVLEEAYWRPGRPESTRRKDAQAKRILERLFPRRRVIQIRAENLNWGGGGMHCATQQQPAVR